MRLTRHSDYSLRVLMFLALRPGKLATIHEIAEAFDISRAHLMKVVHALGKLGYVQTVRGRGGGLELARPAREIRLGRLLQQTEEPVELVECSSTGAHPDCKILPACKLRGVLAQALSAFFRSLDEYTLQDIVSGQTTQLRRLLLIA